MCSGHQSAQPAVSNERGPGPREVFRRPPIRSCRALYSKLRYREARGEAARSASAYSMPKNFSASSMYFDVVSSPLSILLIVASEQPIAFASSSWVISFSTLFIFIRFPLWKFSIDNLLYGL